MSKASKQRPCPALGQNISPAACGEQRHSRLACPPACPHNPFAPENYSQLLETEDRLDRTTMTRLAASLPDRAAFERELAEASRRGPDALHVYCVRRLFFATDAAQTTFARRWELSGFAGLKNDERVLLRAKMQMRIALLEIHRIFANGRVEAVDLLSASPAPMIFQDRSLAGMATRFATFLSWTYPLPHYCRLSGTAVTISDFGDFSAPEIVREIARHLGGPQSEAELRGWLAEHFLKFHAALTAVAQARHQQMLAGMDAKFGKAVYELRAPFAQCRDRLDAAPDVAADDLSDGELNEGFAEARLWVDQAPQSKLLTPAGGQLMLGRILLGQSLWRLETMGAQKLARLRAQFEQQLGERIRFAGERVDDLGARMNAKTAAADAALVPPRLLENPAQFVLGTSRIPALPPGLSREEAEAEILRATQRAFLEDKIPALDHHTPREAARDPALRPKLIQLIKGHVQKHDERNLQTGRTDDINWLLRELGLDEILFDPPPWRPPPPKPAGEAGDEAEDLPGLEDLPEVDPSRPAAPRLPATPLDFEEALQHLEAAMDMFSTAAAAEAELAASGATLLQDADELTVDILSDVDFSFAVTFLLQAWFALVPRGVRAPELDFAELEAAFDANLRALETCAKAKTPKQLEAFFKTGPQPNLMLALLGGFVEAATTAPKTIRPSPDAQPIILALLKSVVEVLDQALRPV